MRPPTIVSSDASAPISATGIGAQLRAVLAKHPGEYAEGGMIPPATARKVPKAMIGRTLTRAESEKLLARLQAR